SSIPDDLIAQEFMAGDLYSIEVIGSSGNYSALQVTDLEMDDDYDCKRVTAPTKLSSELVKKFEKMAIDIAEELNLTGIMDVEVILHENELKILEIDARLPSQTPMAVYKSTGINMVEMLGDLVLQKKREKTENKSSRFVAIEHIQVSRDALTVLGEHIMAVKNPLTMMADFFGADECITNYSSGKNQSFEHQLYKDTDMWVATMIFSSDSREALAIKRENCYKQILAFHNDN
ncbi:ATP-grasp domain-containing protein, partial [bacterium]|nr:ATP-grasp domain-containing protein [bacterium]